MRHEWASIASSMLPTFAASVAISPAHGSARSGESGSQVARCASESTRASVAGSPSRRAMSIASSASDSRRSAGADQ